jgi:hypothetical protein
VVAMCIMGDTVTAGVVTCTMVMVGQAMPITDPLMAGDMLAPATDMRIMDMAAGTTVTGTPATVVGGVATTTRTVLVPAGALRPLVGFGSATRACTHKTFLPPAKMFVFRRRPNGPRRLLLRPRGR